jgi:hypothetical protein
MTVTRLDRGVSVCSTGVTPVEQKEAVENSGYKLGALLAAGWGSGAEFEQKGGFNK